MTKQTKQSWEEKVHQETWRLAAAIWDCSRDKDTESSLDYQKKTEAEIMVLIDFLLHHRTQEIIEDIEKTLYEDEVGNSFYIKGVIATLKQKYE